MVQRFDVLRAAGEGLAEPQESVVMPIKGGLHVTIAARQGGLAAAGVGAGDGDAGSGAGAAAPAVACPFAPAAKL